VPAAATPLRVRAHAASGHPLLCLLGPYHAHIGAQPQRCAAATQPSCRTQPQRTAAATMRCGTWMPARVPCTHARAALWPRFFRRSCAHARTATDACSFFLEAAGDQPTAAVMRRPHHLHSYTQFFTAAPMLPQSVSMVHVSPAYTTLLDKPLGWLKLALSLPLFVQPPCTFCCTHRRALTLINHWWHRSEVARAPPL